ncbi:MAG TPA: hypothetical protein VLX92_25125 [Kofleriaceae bacterium]|nr:hypothetical protein [Kofleriaceae bacterium]
MRTAALALALAACGTEPDTSGCALVPDPSGASARAADVEPILAASCALGGCHLHAPGAGGLVLDDGWVAAVVGVRAQESSMMLVTPGDPDDSWLVHKIYGTFCPGSCDGGVGCGAEMPFGGALSDPERATIVAWIAAGAGGD